MKNHFTQSGQYYIFKLGFDSASIIQRLKIKSAYFNAKYYVSVTLFYYPITTIGKWDRKLVTAATKFTDI